MERLIQEYVQKNNVDGLSLSIIDQGKIVFDYHYESNEHMRYTIGSVSKLFIATGMMILVAEKKCTLEDPVCKYIPGFYPEVTLRMLLNHSSGLDCVNFKGKYTNHPYPQYVDTMIERYKEVPLKSRPGKYSVYTNDGFVIAQRIIEILSESSFHDFLIRKICQPLGMKDTTCPDEKMDEGTYKRAASPFGKKYLQEYVNGIGSGGIYSTSHDLAIFLHSFHTNALLSQESIEEMMKNQFYNHIQVTQNAALYGLGLDHVEMPYFKAMGYKAVTKGGATYGYLSNVIYIPELDLGLAVVSASLKGSVGILAREILGKYLNQEVTEIYLPSFERSIDLGIYGNGNHVYNLYMTSDHDLQVEIYEKGKFIPYATMELKKNRFIAQEAFGFKDVTLAFYEQNGYSYMILDYRQDVNMRCIFAQKLEEQDCIIDLEPGIYVRNNEYIDQRNFDTQSQLSIYIDPNLYLPYPLKAITPTQAIPYVELPGSYAREMTTLEVIDSIHFQLGLYTYEKLKEKPLVSHTIIDSQVHYYSYHGESIESNEDVRIIGLDTEGKLVYDSNLSEGKILGNYIGIAGKENEEIKVY